MSTAGRPMETTVRFLRAVGERVMLRRAMFLRAGLAALLLLHVGGSAWLVRQQFALPRVPVGDGVLGLGSAAAPLRGLSDGGAQRVPTPGLVEYWASWCRACGRSMALLRDLSKRHPELPIMAVNLGEDPDVARAHLSRVGYTGPVARVDDALPVELGVDRIPLTVLVDGAGRLVAAFSSLDPVRLEAIVQWWRASS